MENLNKKQSSILTSADIQLVEEKAESTRIAKLRKRTRRCVCRYCGSSLSLRKITYAAYDEAKIEVYCEKCDRIEYGTEPLIYKMAKYYIDEIKFDYYPNFDETTHKKRMNVATVCDIITWGFKNSGFLSEDGFTSEPQVDESILGEVTALSESELKKINKE